MQPVNKRQPLIVDAFMWWYTAGWQKLAKVFLAKIAITRDYFSIGLLISSLYAPYKQISAASSGKTSLQSKIQDWFDKQFSRVIGSFVRGILIFIGTGWLLIQIVAYCLTLIVWPFIPILPILGLLFTLTLTNL